MKLKEQYSKQATNLLNDQRFLYRVGQKLRDLGLVGDIRNGVIVFLACLTMYLDEKVSILMVSPSSSGKSTMIEKPVLLFPPETVIRRASLSRKAFAYGEGSLDRKIVYINEYSGGREAQLMLRILQSEGAIAHEYTHRGKTRVVKRVGSPVVLTTTSNEVIFEDDSTRFLTVNIEQNSDQILAVLKATIGRKTEDREPDLEVWREAIRMLGARARLPFELPDFLGYVAEQVPRNRPRTMRDWKRWLALIKAVSLCRPQGGSRNVINFVDYCVAHRILNPALTATVLAVNEGELTVQRAVSSLNAKMGRAITIAEVRRYLAWNKSIAYRLVRAAQRHGLIRYEGGTRERNVKRLLPITDAPVAFLPHPKRVLQKVKGIGNSTRFIDPFSGTWKRFVIRKARHGK